MNQNQELINNVIVGWHNAMRVSLNDPLRVAGLSKEMSTLLLTSLLAEGVDPAKLPAHDQEFILAIKRQPGARILQTRFNKATCGVDFSDFTVAIFACLFGSPGDIIQYATYLVLEAKRKSSEKVMVSDFCDALPFGVLFNEHGSHAWDQQKLPGGANALDAVNLQAFDTSILKG